ncbi:MAG: hypothetical protein ACI8WB_004732, partial [Phenylobacterium sp.]
MSEQYIDLPIEQWPDITVRWDLKAVSQHLSADGISEKDFGQPLTIAWIKMQDLDNLLHGHSIKERHETWSIGDKNKVAKVIAHCEQKKSITPAQIQPHS